jgi:PII-like signaling protein
MSTWKKLSIYTSEGSRWGTRPLHEAVISNALAQGLYSAMAFKALEGFGPQLAIPTANRMALPTDLPVEVRILGQAGAIEGFLAAQAEMLKTCIVTLEDVEMAQYPSTSAVT